MLVVSKNQRYDECITEYKGLGDVYGPASKDNKRMR